MKLRVTLKDPDGFSEAVMEAADQVENTAGLSEEEIENLIDGREKKLWHKLKRWVRWNEYIELEFDIIEMTARVIERTNTK